MRKKPVIKHDSSVYHIYKLMINFIFELQISRWLLHFSSQFCSSCLVQELLALPTDACYDQTVCGRYILIYPQEGDVCNHLSLFLCVANHDKLLPGGKRRKNAEDYDMLLQQQQQTQCIPTKWGLGRIRCMQSIPLPPKK
ncbi:uncharacterized protein LOC107877083 isoform X1 [Capsicum annuum]|uniref:uncharacterized protein LOC107877083 isoform X1 n=1 Tax=Capsicum annuum TaxID=4072 RepID=UPI0007BEACD1|nr:uncharacterized protein LOC107877083 isoform X1 [Capsicum annuum]